VNIIDKQRWERFRQSAASPANDASKRASVPPRNQSAPIALIRQSRINGQSSRKRQLTTHKRYDIENLDCDVVDGFFGMMPMAIYALGFTEQTAYRFSSAMHCINIALYFLWVRRNMQAVDASDWRTRVVHSSLYTIALIVIVMNLLNASNIVFHGEFGPYFLACILPLLMASLMFIRLVTRPLWRSVRLAESQGASVAERA
jgi:hypothetical protein